MSTGGYDERQRIGSVKTTTDFYKGKNPIQQQTSDSENQQPLKTVELHWTRRKSGLLQDAKDVNESGKSQAETELLRATKKVKELRKKIEESNLRAKAHIEELQKAKRVGQDYLIALKANEDLMYNKVMKELEKEKHESRQLKVNMTSLLKENSRAKKEGETLVAKARYYVNLVKALTNEVERCNEDHVLVELARVEATKERKVIELQRQEAEQQHSARMEEARKKINSMIKETSYTEELQRLLALTSSESNALGKELEDVRQIDKRTQKVQPDYTALLLSTTEELEAARKKLDSQKAESIQLMDSMDPLNIEIKLIVEETARFKQKEAKTELAIQNLNSKLLRGKAMVQAVCASRDKAEPILLNLSTTIEKYMLEAEAYKNKRIITKEKITAYKSEVEKIKSEMDLAEEKFQAALEELNSVISSEAEALRKLKSSTQKTMHNRALASLHSSRITISTFEYQYLTGVAERATDIAKKKIAAAEAWVEVLKVSEKEILMKTESATKVMTGNTKLAPAKQADLQKSQSPAVRTRSSSFSIKRRPKVMPNLVKFKSGKSVPKNLQAM